MLQVARTPAALFRQMREQGRGLEELELVRRALDLDVELYSARFEPDGTPFQVHGVGTASVMGQVGAPAYVVAVTVVHNAFSTGDWGDGRTGGTFPWRRERVRTTLGDDAARFMVENYGGTERSTSELLADDNIEAEARWRALIRIADLLDKWDDGRVMYSADGRADRKYVEHKESEIIDLARHLGGDELADTLDAAFTRVAAETIPESLKRPNVYSSVIPPRSYGPRPSIAAKAALRRRLHQVRRLRHRIGR